MTKAMTTTQEKAVSLRGFLQSDHIKDQLAMALPKWLSPDRLLRIVFSTAMRNPKILECSRESILQSVMMCAQLGLEPILGRAYLIPYNNNKNVGGTWRKVMECQFQPGYQGLVDLARRSNTISDVFGSVVYEKDDFEYELGTNRHLTHRPALNGDPGKPIGAYVVWELKDGTKHPEFMPLHEIHKRRAKSQSYQWAETGDKNRGGGKRDSVWHEWPEDMMVKTVIKHSSKLVPASIEFMEAVSMDDTAEIGQTYISPFSNQLTLPEPSVQDLILEFEQRVAESAQDAQDFKKWFAEMAQANDKDLDQAKVEVIQNNDFGNMMEAYQKQAPEDLSGQGEFEDKKLDMYKDSPPSQGSKSTQGRKQDTGEGSTGSSGDLDDSHPLKREKWFSRKGATLENYATQFKDKLKDMPTELFEELCKKWSNIYDRPFPFTQDGGEVVEKMEPPEEDDPPTEDIGEVLNSPEAQKLAALAQAYPKAYKQVVEGRTPKDIAMIKVWIDQIKELAEFTKENQTDAGGDF